MAAADNNINFEGNLTRDPELRYTKSGIAVTNLGVAVNESFRNADGEWDQRPNYIDVTVWDEMAENVAGSMASGDRVIVRGKFKYSEWESDDGGKRSKIDVTAESVGASLKWATAEITRTERKGSDSGKKGGRSSSSNRGGGNSRGSGGRGWRQEYDDYDPDEDPF